MCGEQPGALLLLFRNYADRISVGASEPRIQRAAAANARGAGKTGMDLLNVLLDLADAISAGVAIAGFGTPGSCPLPTVALRRALRADLTSWSGSSAPQR